jgi:hypothetical protein
VFAIIGKTPFLRYSNTLAQPLRTVREAVAFDIEGIKYACQFAASLSLISPTAITELANRSASRQ